MYPNSQVSRSAGSSCLKYRCPIILPFCFSTTDKNFEVLADAEKAAFRAKDLTKQLLTFSKGGAPLKRPMLLARLLKDAAVFAARGSKTKCKFNIAEDLLPADIVVIQAQEVKKDFHAQYSPASASLL